MAAIRLVNLHADPDSAKADFERLSQMGYTFERKSAQKAEANQKSGQKVDPSKECIDATHNAFPWDKTDPTEGCSQKELVQLLFQRLEPLPPHLDPSVEDNLTRWSKTVRA